MPADLSVTTDMGKWDEFDVLVVPADDPYAVESARVYGNQSYGCLRPMTVSRHSDKWMTVLVDGETAQCKCVFYDTLDEFVTYAANEIRIAKVMAA
jgi:hypothetical protein